MSTNLAEKKRRQGLVKAAVVTALTLIAGCAEDATTDLEEPAPLDAPAIAMPASVATTTSLGIASWRYQPTADGIVVCGLAAGASIEEAPRIRFWISPGAAAGERVAHAHDSAGTAVVPHEGEVRGGSEALRAAVTAFRADGKAAEKAAVVHHVNDDVDFCPLDQKTFSTWFWGNTIIQITNRNPSYLLKISFQAGGAAAETHYIQPGEIGRYARIFGAWPVTLKHLNLPGAGCARLEVF